VALYERLLKLDPARPRIPVHQFQSVAAEWARGKITAADANTIIAACSGGVGLDAGESTEAQTLVGTVTAIPITGTAVQIADGRARRALRVQEIDQVLLLAGMPGYDTAAALKAKLGV
jgi:hypothetical protein